MKKRRIVMVLVSFALVSALSLTALAEPAQDSPRHRRTEPDKVARHAREINRWLNEHPDLTERVIRNFRQHRGDQMGRRQRRGDQMGRRQQRGDQMGRRQQRGDQ